MTDTEFEDTLNEALELLNQLDLEHCLIIRADENPSILYPVSDSTEDLLGLLKESVDLILTHDPNILTVDTIQ